MHMKDTPEVIERHLNWYIEIVSKALTDLESGADEQTKQVAEHFGFRVQELKELGDKRAAERLIYHLPSLQRAKQNGRMTSQQAEAYMELLHRFKSLIPKINELGVKIPQQLTA